jgi:seryl-tRNA synthetase
MAEMWSRRQLEPDDTMKRILEALEKRGPSAETTFLVRDNDAMRQEIAALKSQVGELTKKRDETLEQFNVLKRGMENMSKMIPKETDLSGVLAQFEEVKKYMADFTSAVGKIKLPEFPEIPNVEIPEYKETNLEPLTALVQSIQEQLA